MRVAIRTLSALALLAAALICNGCGISLSGAGSAQPAAVVSAPAALTANKQAANLPQRPEGQLVLDGDGGDPVVSSALTTAGSEVAVTSLTDGDAASFTKFCAGDVDLVDSQQPITQAEYAACYRNGIEPVQFEVASDAVVLATRNGSDVGLDCLTTAQARTALAAGGGVSNWEQLGGFDLPLTVAGPNAQSETFQLLANTLFGADGSAATGLFGAYTADQNQNQTLAQVVGSDADITAAGLLTSTQADVNALEVSLKQANTFYAEADYQVAKGIRDRRSAAAQAHDLQQLRAAKQNFATVRHELGIARNYYGAALAAQARIATHVGVLGVFSFAYFEANAGALRAMEIDAGDDAPAHNCIYPSQDTVSTASFPLARQLLLTVSLASLRRSDMGTLLHDVLSQDASVATAQGLVPATPQTLVAEAGWLSGATQPDVVYYPAEGK